MKIANILDRVYQDFIMPSRLEEYRKILLEISENDFEQISIRDFLMLDMGKKISGKFCVHRHDIDTDLKTAKKMFQIEKDLGVRSTFYFRLKTLDKDFMQQIQAYGSEVGYHYEEIASYAKEAKLSNREHIHSALPEIQEQFLKNLSYIRNYSQCAIETVSSHGDFVNRKIEMPNYKILEGLNLWDQFELKLEAYNPDFNDYFEFRVRDKQGTKKWTHPFKLSSFSDTSNILILTHPRHWNKNILVNLEDNLMRIYEGVKWKLGI